MSASFIDTNVLVYLVSDDGARKDRARSVVAAGGAVSVQVLNELAHVARRKMGMGWPEISDILAEVRGLLDVHPLTLAIHSEGIAIAARHGFSVWDAMIAASALDAGCEVLLTEDLQHGMTIGGAVQIVDPFR